MTRRFAIRALAVLALAGPSGALAQTEAPPAWPEPVAQLLLLGTFHFSDAGLDDYKPEFDVDIRAPERQRELDEVLDALEAFRPTMVAVEQPPSEQERLDREYAAFRDGRLELPPNEVYQLGFRLAARLGHERVHAVDARRRFYEPWVDPNEYAVQNDQVDQLDPRLVGTYNRMYRYEDALKKRQTLREHFVYSNDPERVLRGHGRYLIDDFEVGVGDEYPGVDSKTAWYNRNLKIFANLQRLLDPKTDLPERIVLIIGSGHVPILRHSALASPQFDLIDVSEVLGAGP